MTTEAKLWKTVLTAHLKEQQRLASLWNDRRRPLDPGRRSLPRDYLYAPGTEEGDAVTAIRRDNYEQAVANVAATRELLAKYCPPRRATTVGAAVPRS